MALSRKYVFTFFRHDFKWKFPSTSVLLYISEIKEEEQRGRAKKSNCSSSPSILFHLKILSSSFYPLPNALPAALPLLYLFPCLSPPLIFHLFPLPLPIPYILLLLYSSTHLMFLLLLLLLIPLPLPHFIYFITDIFTQPSHVSSYSYFYPYYPTATYSTYSHIPPSLIFSIILWFPKNLFFALPISQKNTIKNINIKKYQLLISKNYHIVITFSPQKNITIHKKSKLYHSKQQKILLKTAKNTYHQHICIYIHHDTHTYIHMTKWERGEERRKIMRRKERKSKARPVEVGVEHRN